MSNPAVKHPKVFLDVTIGGARAASGRLVIELFADKTPKTAENFRCLCTGEKGKGKSGLPLHYKGSSFFRVMKDFMAQGGDITAGNGTGGESIYGHQFEDENFTVPHTKRGDLSMVTSRPNANGSQFFLTFVPCPWLNGKHCVFGQVISGWDVIDALEAQGTKYGQPKSPCIIADCGELEATDE